MISIAICVTTTRFNFATLAAIMETGVILEKAINSTGILFVKGTQEQMKLLHGIGGTVSVSHHTEKAG
jgi:hypothetical protein